SLPRWSTRLIHAISGFTLAALLVAGLTLAALLVARRGAGGKGGAKPSFEAYQQSFESALASISKGTITDRFVVSEGLPANLPPHALIVLALNNPESPRLVATVGFGRSAQPHSRPADENVHVELVTYADEEGAESARLFLGVIATLMHLGATGDAWKG